MKRRLIVCCDGTWQDLKQKCPTNVVKMAQAIKPVDNRDIHQILYYDVGVGAKQTDGLIISFLTELGGGALGLGIDYKIQDAYRFLCLNYEPDDEIYLFGFSRGAYTVRSLAGLIYNVGLLHRQFICHISEGYEIYRNKEDSDKAPEGKDAINFRNRYGKEVPIKALCCWDTVGSLGIPDLIPGLPLDNQFNARYRFFDTTINHTIENAFHAVAIDEIRRVFDVTRMKPSAKANPNQIKQMWFVGGHGCVGGGSTEESSLSDIALLWMMEEVEKIGLSLDRSCVENGIKPDYRIDFNNTPDFPFNIAGTNLRDLNGECINLHESVKKRWQDSSCNYRPENLLKCRDYLNA